mmetsp:Transcript_3294/g.7752  ORF Transcript_3294/g.7752 Transcript_3294/m.7752 type:complete len:205 (+) Transcript_3294:104-718(+)
MGAEEDPQPLGRTLSFASCTANVTNCGATIAPSTKTKTQDEVGGNHEQRRMLNKHTSAPTLATTGSVDAASSGAASPLKAGGRYANFQIKERAGRKNAFPFGTGEFPFRPTRQGGSINIPTTVFRNKTCVPMGMAGVIKMDHDRTFTHLDPYCRDRFGAKNFYLSDHAAGAAGANSVLEQISDRPRDDLDRLIAIDCRNARYLQ